MKEKILTVLRQVLDNKNIDWTCSQSNCIEWDSMNQLNIVVELESEFDISLEPEEIVELNNCDDILRIVELKLSQK